MRSLRLVRCFSKPRFPPRKDPAFFKARDIGQSQLSRATLSKVQASAKKRILESPKCRDLIGELRRACRRSFAPSRLARRRASGVSPLCTAERPQAVMNGLESGGAAVGETVAPADRIGVKLARK